MRKSLLSSLMVVTLALSACDSQGLSSPELSAAPDDASPTAAALPNDGLPIDTTAEASADQDCPYLDSQWVADTNGQRMTRVAVDQRFKTPACIFWSYPEDPQATVIVREMPSVEEARAVVDWAAPIDSTEPAEFDGWSGGRGVFEDSYSVFAVQKDNKAVLVWSNQAQTLKAELITKETIKNLTL
ncbi:DUF2020 domain-containing protein [Corynebacterium striatum]